MNVGGIVFLVIILVVIGALIVVAIFGSRKSKKTKKEKLSKQTLVESSALTNHIELYVVLAMLLKKIKLDLAKINLTGKAVGDINEETSKILEKIRNSHELREIYKSEDRKKEFQPIIDLLWKVKANKWEEQAFFAINLIKAKMNAFLKQDQYLEIIKQVEDKYKWS